MSSASVCVFDRQLVRWHHDRAAAKFAEHDALFQDTALQLIDRLSDIKQMFKEVLALGDSGAILTTLLRKDASRHVTASHLSARMLRRIADVEVIADEENLPFAPAQFDLIISNLNLHWVNDLPGTLIQIKGALKPQGFFTASLLGGETLHELRGCLLEAEQRLTGGVSPRLSPVIDLLTLSHLMQRAGFEVPVIDSEIVTLTYPNMFALLHDLRGMGQTNASPERLRHPTRRHVFLAAAELYHERFSGPTGRINATFEILYAHGFRAEN